MHTIQLFTSNYFRKRALVTHPIQRQLINRRFSIEKRTPCSKSCAHRVARRTLRLCVFATATHLFPWQWRNTNPGQGCPDSDLSSKTIFDRKQKDTVKTTRYLTTKFESWRTRERILRQTRFRLKHVPTSRASRRIKGRIGGRRVAMRRATKPASAGYHQIDRNKLTLVCFHHSRHRQPPISLQ